MINVSILEVNVLKNCSTLAASDPINLSTKLGFVSINCPMETYFVVNTLEQLIYVVYVCMCVCVYVCM